MERQLDLLFYLETTAILFVFLMALLCLQGVKKV